jgi:type IV secretion system protein TrbC
MSEKRCFTSGRLGRFARLRVRAAPGREGHPPGPRLLNVQKRKGSGGANPQAGAARLTIRTAPAIAMITLLATLIILASCLPSYAAGSGMPWEAPLQRILESIEGPVAKIIAVIIIIVTGLTLAFGDMGGGFRRLLQIVFGLSIAFAATSFFLSFFAFAGGALIN